MTIISIGFGEFTAMALRAVAMLFGGGGGGYGEIMGAFAILAVMIGIAFVVGKTVITAKLEIVPLVVAVVLFYAMFVPKVTVLVEDRLDGRVDVVDHVPIGVALAGALTSSPAIFLTEFMQTVFYSGGSEAQLTTNAFAYPLRLMLHMRDLETIDLGPIASANIVAYHRDCVVPLLLSGDFPLARMSSHPFDVYFNSSGEIEDLLRRHMTTQTFPQGGVAANTCLNQAAMLHSAMEFSDVGDTMNAEITRGVVTFLRSRMGESVSLAPSEGGTAGNADLLLSSQSVKDNLQAVLSVLDHERKFLVAQIASNIQNAGGAQAAGAEAYWMTQAMETQRVSTATEASGFLRMMTVMMGLMQFLFIAITPVVAIIALAKVGGGFKVYAGWLLLGVWSASFMIVATIIDYWATRNVQMRYTDHFHGSGVESALSLPGLAGAYNYIGDTLATANTFLAATPIVTLVVLTGNMFALAGLAGRVAGGPDIGTQAGMTAISDQGAGALPPNEQPAANQERFGFGSAGTVAAAATSVSYGSYLESARGAALRNEESASSSHAEAVSQVDSKVHTIMSAAAAEISAGKESGAAISQAAEVFDATVDTSGHAHTLTELERAAVTVDSFMRAQGQAGLNLFGTGASVATGAGSSQSAENADARQHALEDASSQQAGLRSGEGFSLSGSESAVERLTSSSNAQVAAASQTAIETRNAYQTAQTQASAYSEQATSGGRYGSQFSIGQAQVSNMLGRAAGGEFGGNVTDGRDLISSVARSVSGSDPAFMELVNERAMPGTEGNSTDNMLHALAGLQNMAADNSLAPEHSMAASQMLGRFFDKATGSSGGVGLGTNAAQTIGEAREAHSGPSRAAIDAARSGAESQGVENVSAQAAGQVSGGRTEVEARHAELPPPSLSPEAGERIVAGKSAELNQRLHSSIEDASGDKQVEALRGATFGMALGEAPSNAEIRASGLDTRGQSFNDHIQNFSNLFAGEGNDGKGAENMAQALFQNKYGGSDGNSVGAEADDFGSHLRGLAQNPQRTEIGTAMLSPLPSSVSSQAAVAYGSGGLAPESHESRAATQADPGIEAVANQASTALGSHWQAMASDTGKDTHFNGAMEKPEDLLAYIHDNYMDPLAHQATGGGMYHSGAVNEAAFNLSGMTADDPAFLGLQAAYQTGDTSVFRAAIERETGLVNNVTNPAGAASQRAADYLRTRGEVSAEELRGATPEQQVANRNRAEEVLSQTSMFGGSGLY